MKKELKNNLEKRISTIGVIGLGYVGLPILLRYHEVGFKAFGFDIDSKKIKSLNEKILLKDISVKKISQALESGLFATTNFEHVKNVDVIIICVPTPLNDDNTPNLNYIKKTLNQIKPHLKNGQILVLESTTYPGTTEELIVPFIKKCQFKIGKNFFIGYSPERLDPGNKNFTFKNIPKVTSGYTPDCLDLINSLYVQVVENIVPVSSLRAAEMTKMLENIQRSVNIGLMNEMKIVAEKMEIDLLRLLTLQLQNHLDLFLITQDPVWVGIVYQ